ncbi:MAG TPA: alpha/beta fold hydrolase [Terracidiphilus sp.]|nr:alpha/beta fold hydrolase [Terracidiphilus sp.]
MRAHDISFTVAFGCISRTLIVRDRIFGWVGTGATETPGLSLEKLKIPSGENLLDAVFLTPTPRPARAAVLLCHGIGETIQHWFPVQRLLAENGVASLIFDYSGYGRSTGKPHWEQFEQDAISAFAQLERMAPQIPVALLGFSLGSGVAAATVHRVRAERLILCQAFTSFRSAAAACGIPRALDRFVPPIWNANTSLANCKLPVLIVHGEKDRLFPVEMAHELAGCCAAGAEVVLVPNTSHNQPFRKPRMDYWGMISDWIAR